MFEFVTPHGLFRAQIHTLRDTLLASLETRMPHAAPALVVLRQQREQDRLKLLRKLVKRLERLVVSLFKQVIDAECQDLHGRYLARRQAILEICDRQRRHPHNTHVRSLVAAGALAITSGIYAKIR